MQYGKYFAPLICCRIYPPYLNFQNQELVTAGQLQEKGDTQELENRIADLQEEVSPSILNRGSASCV